MAEAVVLLLVKMVVSYAVSYAIGDYMKERAAKKQLKKALSGLQDRTAMLKQGSVTRNMVLGRARVSGPLMCWFTWSRDGNNRRDMHTFAIALAGHEIDAVEAFMVNDEKVEVDADGFVTTTKWIHTERHVTGAQVTFVDGQATLPHTPDTLWGGVYVPGTSPVNDPGYMVPLSWEGNVVYNSDPSITSASITYIWTERIPCFRFRVHRGAPGQVASPSLIAAAAAAGEPTLWDATCKGAGVAYMEVEMYSSIDVLGDIGIPNFSAIVRGAKAYDPRTEETAWTQNPALLAAWFIVHSGFAPACTWAEVNEAELIASANVCDEDLEFGTFEGARYDANGQLFSEVSPLENLQHICDAMDGEVLWVGGKWQVRAGYHDPATTTLNEGCLSGDPIQISPARPRDQLFNTVAGTFADAAHNYQRTSFPAVRIEDYVEEDGGEELQLLLDFTLVANAIRCQMLAWQRLVRSRQQLTVQLGTNLKGYDLWPTKNVLLELAEFGFEGKEFRVAKRSFNGATLGYVLQETGENIWEWEPGFATDPPAVEVPDSSLPEWYGVPEIALLSVFTGTDALLQAADGTIISRIGLVWSDVGSASVTNGGRIEWQYRRFEEEQWNDAPLLAGTATSCFIGPVQDGAIYVVQGRCVTASGRGGLRTVVPVVVVGKTEPPPPFDLFTVAAQADGTREYTCGYSVTQRPVDWLGGEIRYLSGTHSEPPWESMTPLQVGQSYFTNFPIERNLLPEGDYTFAARSLDRSGNLSTAIYTTATLPPRRAGAAIAEFDEALAGWPGTKTDCHVEGAYLVANNDYTWDDLSSWTAWTSWDSEPAGTIVYEAAEVDLGANHTGSIDSTEDADGTVTVELKTKAEGGSYGSYSTTMTFTGKRYLTVRITVTGAAPVVRSWTYSVF